jgi:hypothetical protein
MSDIIFFSPVPYEAEIKFLSAIMALKPGNEIRICRRIEELVRCLLEGQGAVAAIVLCAPTRNEVSDLLLIRDGLSDRRIVILPDMEPETLEKGHRLTPRFLTSIDGDPGEVTAVLVKMIEKFRTKGLSQPIKPRNGVAR